MNSKFFNKSRHILRRALAIMLCLIVVLQGFVQAFAGDTDVVDTNYCSYEWTLIHNEAELRKYVEKGATDQDGDRRFIDNTVSKSTADNDINHWYKVLIAYETCGRQYFFSGSSVSDEEYNVSRVLPQYFYDEKGNIQHIGDDKLNSVSGLHAPYIKYAGDDGDNSNRIMINVRFAQETTTEGKASESLGSNVLAANISWYGVAHAAAAYGELKSTSASNPSSHKHGSACNSNIQTAVTMYWSGTKFQAFYNVKGAQDRWWSYSDDNSEIEICKTPDYDESNFYLYIGKPSRSQLIDSSLVVEQMTTTYNTTIVTEKALIEIPKGACVVMEGLSKLNGSILVNGGTLIVRGTLDTSEYINSDHDVTDYLRPGSIKVSNGGCLYVEETGVMCLRLATADLLVEKGSTVTISGSCLVAGRISIKDSTVLVRPGAILLHGAKVPSLTSAVAFGKQYVSDHRNDTLDSYVTGAVIDNYYVSTQGLLKIEEHSTFDVRGLYYMYVTEFNKNLSYALSSSINVNIHYNAHSKISDMMRQW